MRFGRLQTGITLIGEGTNIEGNLTLRSTLHVEGLIDGSIRAEGEVIVGKNGIVKGEIRAREVKIAGKVEGAVISSGSLHMLTGGLVEGDAIYQSLQVQPGGVINGSTSQQIMEPFEIEETPNVLPGGQPPASPRAIGQA